MEVDAGPPQYADVTATHEELRSQLQREKAERLEERRQTVRLMWGAFTQLVQEKERLWQNGAHAAAPRKWREVVTLPLSRPRLELDLLSAMRDVRPAAALFKEYRVTFEGEVVSRPEQKVVVRLYDGVAVDGKPVPVAPRALAEKETDEERE